MTDERRVRSVGLVGVGALGLAIAERLIAAGFDVFGYRRSSQADFESAGGRPAANLAELAQRSDLLLVLLPSDEALNQVMVELANVLCSEQVIVCLSTHKLEAKHVAKELAEGKGAILLDGEVSGTPPMVRMSQAIAILAGESAAVDQAASVLEKIFASVQRLPVFGDAVKLKMLANYLVSIHTLAAADVLLMAESMGFDPQRAIEVLSASAGASRILATRGPMMARGEPGTGDLNAFTTVFEKLRQAAGGSDLLDFTESCYLQTLEQIGSDNDVTGVYTTLRRNRTRHAN